MKQFIKHVYLKVQAFFLNTFLFFLSPRINPPNPQEIKKILIVRLDRIGDLILSLPLIHAIRLTYPNAQITLLTTALTKSLLDHTNVVDQIIIYEKGWNDNKPKIDMVVDSLIDYPLHTAWISFLTGSKYRVGFNTFGRGVFYNIKVNVPEKRVHFIEESFSIMSALKANTFEPTLHLPVKEEASLRVKQFFQSNNIKDNDRIVCFHPGGHFETQRWSAQRFGELANLLIDEHNVKVIILASDNESEIVQNIQSTSNNRAIVFHGFLLDSWAALLSQSHLLVANNSGMLHMACAVKTPTVSMMGPTESPRWLPYGEGHIVIRKDLPCIGCNSGKCRIKTFDCMNFISVKEVYEASVRQLL